MPKNSKQIGLRLSTQEVEAIDAFYAKMKEELQADFPGMKFNQADAIRLLINTGLREEGFNAFSARRKDKKPRK